MPAPSPASRAGGAAPTTGRCSPVPGDGDAIDLNCAASSAPPGLAAAYAEAAAELPAYFGGHGYFPAGLPLLQAAIAATYDARGLPTDPDQIMVTPGALSAAAVVAQAFTGPGDRVLVESPVYPNATHAHPAQRRPARRARRSTRTAGTSTPRARRCARPRRSSPT